MAHETLAAILRRHEYGDALPAQVERARAHLEGCGLRVRVVEDDTETRLYVMEGKR